MLSFVALYVFFDLLFGYLVFNEINSVFEKTSKANVGSEFHKPLTKWEKINYVMDWAGVSFIASGWYYHEYVAVLLTPFKDMFIKYPDITTSLTFFGLVMFAGIAPFVRLLVNRAVNLLELNQKKEIKSE